MKFLTRSTVTALHITLLLLLWSHSRLALADTNYRFDIRSQPLSQSLIRFSYQSGLAIVFPDPITKGVQAPELQGDYSVGEALARLLQDTGLAFKAAEIEPFKTAITLHFLRAWPFVLYAGVLLAVGLFVERFYCRYLCPLGAALAIPSKFKIFDWLTRLVWPHRESAAGKQQVAFMVRSLLGLTETPPPDAADRPLVAATMFGSCPSAP